MVSVCSVFLQAPTMVNPMSQKLATNYHRIPTRFICFRAIVSLTQSLPGADWGLAPISPDQPGDER